MKRSTHASKMRPSQSLDVIGLPLCRFHEPKELQLGNRSDETGSGGEKKLMLKNFFTATFCQSSKGKRRLS